MEENLVYHYTSLDALRSILGDTICLWATRYDKLNDPSEQIWAEKYVIDAIKKHKDYKNDTSKDVIDWFRKDTYVLSLCKNKDDRNMWRLYCNDGQGVSLILDKDELKKFCRCQMEKDIYNFYCIVEDVEYSSYEMVDNAIARLKMIESFNIGIEEDASRWMRMVPFIKNEDFRIEHEVRCAILRDFEKITIPYDKETNGPGHKTVKMNTSGVKQRMRGKELIPYIELKLPIKVLKGIIIGYEIDEKNVRDYISNITEDKVEYRHLCIEKSKLFSSINQKEYNENINK